MTESTGSDLASASRVERNRAWRRLYDENFDRIYRLVWRFGVAPDQIEDVTQRVFMVAHERIMNDVEVENVPAWLRGIVVRVVAHHHRWRRLRAVKTWLMRGTLDAVAEKVVTPEAEMASLEAQARVSEVLAKMSPKLRSVLVLVDLEELSLEQAAEALSIPVNTVRSRRRLARDEFRRLWQHRVARSPRDE